MMSSSVHTQCMHTHVHIHAHSDSHRQINWVEACFSDIAEGEKCSRHK
jgi:hypothetical protein